MAKQWAADINEAVSAIRCRPKTLLVIVNPWGGNRRANKAWSRHAFPVFTRAGTTSFAHLKLPYPIAGTILLSSCIPMCKAMASMR